MVFGSGQKYKFRSGFRNVLLWSRVDRAWEGIMERGRRGVGRRVEFMRDGSEGQSGIGCWFGGRGTFGLRSDKK